MQDIDSLLSALELQRLWGADEEFHETPASFILNQSKKLIHKKSQESGEQPDINAEDLLRAEDFKSLIRKAKESQKIKDLFLFQLATHDLYPIYRENALFTLITDIPNAEEDKAGHLLTGKFGQLLQDIFFSIDIDISKISIVPSLPWRPPGERLLSTPEWQVVLPILYRNLSLCHTKRIVCLGSLLPSLLLHQEKRLKELRKTWQIVDIPLIKESIPMLTITQPSQIVKAPRNRLRLWEDLIFLIKTIKK